MADKPRFRVLVLNGSLKRSPEESNTERLAKLVLTYMKEYEEEAEVEPYTVRLADAILPPGVGADQGEGDEWPVISAEILKADIVLFATPIWWGGRSSIMQRVLERMDAMDEQYIKEGKNLLLNKVAGIVITGSEDGAMSTMANLMVALTWFGFALPPECGCYWVGEVGTGGQFDEKKLGSSQAVHEMAARLAGNLLYYAILLRKVPMEQAPGRRRRVASVKGS